MILSFRASNLVISSEVEKSQPKASRRPGLAFFGTKRPEKCARWGCDWDIGRMVFGGVHLMALLYANDDHRSSVENSIEDYCTQPTTGSTAGVTFYPVFVTRGVLQHGGGNISGRFCHFTCAGSLEFASNYTLSPSWTRTTCLASAIGSGRRNSESIWVSEQSLATVPTLCI